MTGAIAFLLAGTVKGVIGLGLPLTSIAILTMVTGLREAIPLIVLPVLITNIWQVLQGSNLKGLFLRFWTMNLAMAAGTWCGTILLFIVDPAALLIILGVVIGAYAVINLTGWRLALKDPNENIWSPSVGAFSGILTGTTGSVGMPVAIYLQALGLSKDDFVQGIAISFMIGAAFWLPALHSEGVITREVLFLSAAGLVPAFAGMWIGSRLRSIISETLFRNCVMIFFLIAAANLIRRGLI